jgi:hypothetical protein
MEQKTTITRSVKSLCILLFIGLLVFTGSKAIANNTETKSAKAMSTEWVYVTDGKVYFFDEDGILCYKLLKDAQYRYNYKY